MYYNQRDYADIPYPHASKPNATVASGGCGVVCASMIVEAFCGDGCFPPDKSAMFSIACGAREHTGTNMRTLAASVARSYGLEYTTTSDENVLREWLKNGGWAIANIGGDRSGYKAVFCTTGHYVVVRGVSADGRAIILDPDYYTGKFRINGRAGRVELHYPDVLVSLETLHQDTLNRSPNYYLFKREETPVEQNEPSAWAKESWEKAVQLKVFDGTNPKEPLTREQAAAVLDRLGLLK